MSPEIVKIVKSIKEKKFNDQNIKQGMDMILIEILQLNCYAVPELPPSRNPLHNCIDIMFEHVHFHQETYWE